MKVMEHEGVGLLIGSGGCRAAHVKPRLDGGGLDTPFVEPA